MGSRSRKKKTITKRRRKMRAPWVTYSRCFLLTLGAIMLGIIVMIIAAPVYFFLKSLERK
jgi:hypothetical protein